MDKSFVYFLPLTTGRFRAFDLILLASHAAKKLLLEHGHPGHPQVAHNAIAMHCGVGWGGMGWRSS